MKRLWKARFKTLPDKDFFEFSKSINYDFTLFKYELEVGEAWVEALYKKGFLNNKERGSLLKSLKELNKDWQQNKLKNFNIQSFEDVHTLFIYLLSKKTKYASKLHTGRSRNDLIVCLERLYCRDKIKEFTKYITSFQKAILSKCRQYVNQPFIGYTHLKRAQVISFAHVLLSYITSFQRHKERLGELYKRVNVLVLGSQALGGAGVNLDWQYLKKKLKFSEITFNSIDATTSRDYILEFLFILSLISLDFSRISADMLYWLSDEVDLISISEKFLTGSSSMPHKKNPDSLELIRGSSSFFISYLSGFMTLLKGLPSGYNRDFQFDKIYLFRAVEEMKILFKVFTKLLRTVKVNSKKVDQIIQEDFRLFSIDICDYLVRKGVPHRKSYEITASLLTYCEQHHLKPTQLSLKELKKISKYFDKDFVEIFNPCVSIQQREAPFSSSPDSVKRRIEHFQKILS